MYNKILNIIIYQVQINEDSGNWSEFLLYWVCGIKCIRSKQDFLKLLLFYYIYVYGLLSLDPRPDPSGRTRTRRDIRLIPRASLTLITFRREISLRQSHCRKHNL